MPGRKVIHGRVAISILMGRDSLSSSPASGNGRTTGSCLSSESSSLTSSPAPPRPDEGALVDVRGDAVDEVARRNCPGLAVLALGLGDQQEGDRAVARLHALGARHAARSGQREGLVVLGGDGAVAVLDGVGAAA